MNEELFAKYEQLISLYRELYKKGLIGLQQNYIQLENKEFVKLFQDPEEIKIKRISDESIELFTIHNNVQYITLI